MAQSFYQLYVHIVFSTKKREWWLDETIRDRVHAYMANGYGLYDEHYMWE